MTTIAVAIIVAVFGPMLLSWLNARQRRKEKLEDYARLDAVAAHTAEVAAQAAEAARLLVLTNAAIANTAAVTNGKLDVIHDLVNSTLTAAKRSELDANVRDLASMRELVDWKRAQGLEPSIDTLAVIEAAAAKVVELSAALRDRTG